MFKNKARKFASVALAGTLAVTGAAGIVGVQALAPSEIAPVQTAQAATTAQNWYAYVWNNKNTVSSCRTVKIADNKLKIAHVGAICNGNAGRYVGTGKAKSSYAIASNCTYYKKWSQKWIDESHPGKNNSAYLAYGKKTTKGTMLKLLKKANKKRGSSASGTKWTVAFQVKNGKVVKIAAQPNVG